MRVLTPPRVRGMEILDDPNVDPHLVRRSLMDVVRSNRIFGGTSAALAELRPLFREGRTLTLLDVGSGAGDISATARKLAERRKVVLSSFAFDSAEELAPVSRRRGNVPLCGDARALPFPDRSVDIVLCSQTLHHFPDEEAVRVILELDRVARERVIISDIRRSWFAAAGIWMASFPLRFHPVSRHDGVVSVMRGFTTSELRQLVWSAIGRRPQVRRRPLFRVTASWSPETE
jgi:SAM-dependent methyltransferase